MTAVDVPEDFACLGFTGLFNLECTFPTPEVAAMWRDLAPCLIHRDQFALISVDEHDVGVLVRRDMDAICDLFFMPRGFKRPVKR